MGVVSVLDITDFPHSGIQTLSSNMSKIEQVLAATIDAIHSVYKFDEGQVQMRLDWIKELVHKAFESTADEYQLAHAAEWGADFVWPSKVFHRDKDRLLEVNGDFESLIRKIHQSHAIDRLSKERIDATLDINNPEYSSLHQLAMGINVRQFTDPKFIPNEYPPPIRNVHHQVSKAIDKLSYEGWLQDRVVIIPTEIALELKGIHFSPAHWTSKKGKKCGRLIWDGSDDSTSNCLNSVIVRETMREHFGAIINPDLNDIMRMILFEESQYDPSKWKDLVMGIGDVAAAFTLMNFNEEDSVLMASQLENDLTMIFHTGHFGWSGTPFAFGVITRGLRHEFKRHLRGSSDIYVDDYFWVCLQLDNTWNVQKSSEIIESLLGPTSVAKDKLKSSRKLDIIGWHFDLDLRVVSLTQRAINKLVHAMFSADVTDKFSLRDIQKLASWTSLYSQVLRHLRPFSACLYLETVGMVNLNVRKTLGIAAQGAIMIWRITLCMLCFNPSKFARTFDSFKEVPPKILIEYDASLTGLGIRISELIYNPGEEVPVGKNLIGVDGLQFSFTLEGDSSYQNTCEFLAVVVAFLVLGRLGWSHISIRLIGDSVTSNHWCADERYKGSASQRASFVYTLIATHFHLWVSDSEWISSESNEEMDGLSRGLIDPILDWGLTSDQVFSLSMNQCVLDLISSCNPQLGTMDWESTINLWRKVSSWIGLC